MALPMMPDITVGFGILQLHKPTRDWLCFASGHKWTINCNFHVQETTSRKPRGHTLSSQGFVMSIQPLAFVF
jgi:hypothetical protein